MSSKLAPGLMRLNYRGEIVPCNYDFDTKHLGLVGFTLPIAFSEEYMPAVCRWSRHDLWKALVCQEDAVASLIVNNVFLVTVSKSSVVIHTKADRQQPQIAAGGTHLLHAPTTPIGYVRTSPEVKDVNVPPYLLFMDDYNRVSLNGRAPVSLPDAVPCTDLQLYKTLLTSSRSAIYMSKSGPKYL